MVGDRAVAGVSQVPAKLLEQASGLMYEQVLTEFSSNKDQTYGDIVLGLILMGISVVIAFVVFYAYIQLQILAPAKHLVDVMGRLAAGNFSESIRARTGDEFGRIAESSEAVRQSLNRIMGEVGQSTKILMSEVDALGSVVSATQQGVLEQQAQTEQVATAINQMTATVQEVSRSAGCASEVTSSADSEANIGCDVVSRTVDNIGLLTKEIGSAADTMAMLSKDSEEIDAVVDVIRGI